MLVHPKNAATVEAMIACMSGDRPACREAALEGRRFCAKHQEQLDRIREGLKAEGLWEHFIAEDFDA